MYLIKDNLKGFKIFFDVDNIIIRMFVLDVILNGVCFIECCLRNCIVLNFGVMIGIVIVGILSGIFIFSLVIVNDRFDVVCEKVF